ncbi:sperm flagellar protein 1-like isoform X2 [Dreissena polymorpha]|uniref:sperm flagellar protein 1-like isoform X2 n=1 Tax=Dreissena polymorpha TaxID=45954 RepID=UPI002263CDA5|nr:sperm flagellar protein 1-like isoform X2 [Dreissena polymorpha]
METITARKDLNGMTKVDMEEYFDDVEVESLYSWIDRIPLSRPKKNISKDFSDAVLCAEVIKHYFPRMVETHNYTPAASTKQKLENWYLLNRRVLRRLELDLSDDVLRALANGKPKVIERVLMLLRLQIDKMLEKTGRDGSWRRQELYYTNPDPVYLRLRLNSPPSHSNTPPGIKSPRGPDSSSRSLSPNRLTKSEGAAPSPRKYQKGEIPHGHPDRTREIHSDYHHRPPNPGLEALAFDYPFTHFAERSYFADKPLPLVPKPFLPAVDNVPRILFEEKEMECQAKQETIQILEAKIRRLNHLLHLKDVRIDDLHNTLQQTVGFGYSSYRKT